MIYILLDGGPHSDRLTVRDHKIEDQIMTKNIRTITLIAVKTGECLFCKKVYHERNFSYEWINRINLLIYQKPSFIWCCRLFLPSVNWNSRDYINYTFDMSFTYTYPYTPMCVYVLGITAYEITELFWWIIHVFMSCLNWHPLESFPLNSICG